MDRTESEMVSGEMKAKAEGATTRAALRLRSPLGAGAPATAAPWQRSVVARLAGLTWGQGLRHQADFGCAAGFRGPNVCPGIEQKTS